MWQAQTTWEWDLACTFYTTQYFSTGPGMRLHTVHVSLQQVYLIVTAGIPPPPPPDNTISDHRLEVGTSWERGCVSSDETLFQLNLEHYSSCYRSLVE